MREVGIKRMFLVKPASTQGLAIGSITAAVEFVDDYRPALNVNRRYAKIDTMEGCIWNSDGKDFLTKEDGNAFYNQLKAEGYVVGTEDQVRNFVRRAAGLTY